MYKNNNWLKNRSESQFDTYRTYLAVRLHFGSGSYDYFKYNGKVKSSVVSFLGSNNRQKFVRLDSKLNTLGINKLDFFVANFIADKHGSALYNQRGVDLYKEYKNFKETQSIFFDKDLQTILKNNGTDFFPAAWAIKNQSTPTILLDLYMQDDISIYSFCLMAELFNLIPVYDMVYQDIFFWAEASTKIKKAHQFIIAGLDIKKIFDRVEKLSESIQL